MNNVKSVKGIINHIWKSEVKEDPKYGPSAQFKITIDGAQYSIYCNLKNKPEPFKVGDEVSFDYKFDEKFAVNQIINNKNDGYSLKNLTTPALTERKESSFSGTGFKANPERDLRICVQENLKIAADILKHNNPDTKITINDMLVLAKQLTEFTMEFKLDPKPMQQSPFAPIPTNANPLPSNTICQDEEDLTVSYFNISHALNRDT